MSIQKEIAKAKAGLLKDVARLWIESGYTADDYDILKRYVGYEIYKRECDIAELNSKSPE